ncbi:MAG TPA: Crp/Fnr family transcriptional regulator [Patescibacteria group bacterium]|jgi:CRP-like cAMP-binding protein|nr:Crp/Fnr family transcriptional regulator [Patescibacteria group bacterium]
MKTLEELIETYPSQAYAKGQTILLNGEVPKAVYIIEKGLVKAYTITSDGTERQVALHMKHEAIPVGFGVGLIEHAQYFYEAYSDCVVRLVPRGVFPRLLKQDAEILYRNHVLIVSRYLSSLDQISALEHPRAGDKVAFMLFNMANQVGTKIRPYKTRLKLTVTQQEIADALGLARETTGVELKKLEQNKLISHTRKNYVLYMERLRAYLSTR